MSDVVIIDYGIGNLLSVRRAIEFCGASVDISNDPSTILSAPRVILPGVGAFSNGMAELRRLGLDNVVRQIATCGTPLLGICLGMQMLLDGSDEFGANSGLGLIPGWVVKVPPIDAVGNPLKIPHIGWGSLTLAPGRTSWCGTLLEDVHTEEAVYFVHSFMAVPQNESNRVADCHYSGVAIAAVIQNGNITGCQFHPEKSGDVGLRILRRFVTQ